MNKIFLENSISDILKLIHKKKISPKELLSISKKIYEEEGKKFKSWSHFDLNKSNTDLGITNSLLKGIPFGAKDIFNTLSFPTEMGSSIWSKHYAGNNARVIDNLISSGAHIIVKTVTAEFAVHSLNET